MTAVPGEGPGILEVLVQPPRCRCCGNPFGEDGVRQSSASREWLACQSDIDTSSLGICEACAAERDACPRCGRVPRFEAGSNPFLRTRQLRKEDGLRLRTAGLDDLAGYCEPCVVRDFLMDDDLFEMPVSRRAAFDLTVIVARHLGWSYLVSERGTPIPGDDVAEVEQVAALVCASLIGQPRKLRFAVENEARDPAFRRALGMYAELFEGHEHAVPPLLRTWLRRRDAGELPRQASNSPAFRHANFLIALILVDIGNLFWVRAAGLKQTRSSATDPDKALSICDAVAEGLREAGSWIEYEAIKQVRRRYTYRGEVADMSAAHWWSVQELALELGNVAEACRQSGMDRTTYYKLKRRYRDRGLASLRDVPPNRRNHPQATPSETVARIVALALEHPDLGCNRLQTMLAKEGPTVSAATVQKILNRKGLGTRNDRRAALEMTRANRI